MVTIKDVAQDAGVAVGTVSKVINGQYVSEKNRMKVEESVKKLGYQMNFYARGLKTRNTCTVAAIVPEILNPFFAIWVYHIEQELYKNGYKMLLCNTQGTIEKEEYYFRMAAQNKVDGIICVTYRDAEPYVSEEIPLVSLDRHFEKKVSCISSDNYHGGELAAQKMISTGSKSLLYLRSGSVVSGETLKRGTGFADCCKASGIPCETVDLGDDFQIFENGHSSIDHALCDFLISCRRTGRMRYDGIYTSTDSLAWVLLTQMRKLGIQVPKEVQIIGHDGLRMMNRGEYMVSSIAQPVEEMAQKSVELVLRKIRGEDTDILTILPVKFVDGGTTR
ncbi:MAG: LacI family DNA-binding transcriptional regulator [Eubacteriales bacterium]|nr:LacI family DNA-binding transcriptional regulator [Eubacteriales bacterium]